MMLILLAIIGLAESFKYTFRREILHNPQVVSKTSYQLPIYKSQHFMTMDEDDPLSPIEFERYLLSKHFSPQEFHHSPPSVQLNLITAFDSTKQSSGNKISLLRIAMINRDSFTNAGSRNSKKMFKVQNENDKIFTLNLCAEDFDRMLERNVVNLYDDKDTMIGFDDIVSETADTIKHSQCRYYLRPAYYLNQSPSGNKILLLRIAMSNRDSFTI